MLKISCYQTSNLLLSKTFCALVEKCYYGSFRVLVVAADKNLIATLDKSLWTYSKKHFIPHATIFDPMPEMQNILISDRVENLNNANIIIFINVAEDELLQFFSKLQEKKDGFVRIMFLNDETASFSIYSIKDLVKKSPIQSFELESFAQDSKGAWQKAG